MSRNGFNNKGGPPTKYTDDMIVAVDKYLDEVAADGKKHLPKIESFALYVGVVKKTLYNWAKKHPKFQKSLDLINACQLEMLVDMGIFGGKLVNTPIITIMLVNNHGMKSAKVDNNINGEIKNEFTDEQITKIAERVTRGRAKNGDTPSAE